MVIVFVEVGMMWKDSGTATLLTFYSLRLTLCTASFNIQKFCVLHTVRLCVLCGSQNKQRLFPCTALTYQFLKTKQRVFTERYEMGL